MFFCHIDQFLVRTDEREVWIGRRNCQRCGQLGRVECAKIIVENEIDQIRTEDKILHELPRARSNGYLESAKPGVMGINSDFGFGTTSHRR